jgi:hypothetical protein
MASQFRQSQLATIQSADRKLGGGEAFLGARGPERPSRGAAGLSRGVGPGRAEKQDDDKYRDQAVRAR